MLENIKKILRVIIVSYIFIWHFHSVSSENVSVQVSTKNIVNDVSDKFISFSVDPKVILELNDELKRNDYMRMAKSFSPAYIRIAGPSTSELLLEKPATRIKANIDKKNPTDSVSKDPQNNENSLSNLKQWKMLVEWMKSGNFTPFIALNNAEKIFGRNWNPKEAIKILAMVDKMKVGEFIWQLGYECGDQTSEKYLNDLKTLKMLMDAFNSGKNGDWKIASGDATKCFGENPAAKIYNFLLHSSIFLDAVVLNSDATVDSLNTLDEEERKTIETKFAEKNTQLWMAVGDSMLPDDEEAIYWLNKLGEAALDGYAVVFKELTHLDINKPSMSSYVSILHKKLVGSKVLEVLEETASLDVSVFAQCSNLQHISSGAVTLFATNAGLEKSSISIKIPVTENDGEIMQYLLNQDSEGKIIVNGKVMENEGDLQPNIKKVKAFKTLTVSMPAKSVGFWVITKANVKSCSVRTPEDTNIIKNKLEHKKLLTENTADHLHQVIQEMSKGSFDRSKRSLDDYYVDDSKQTELNTSSMKVKVSDNIDDLKERLLNFDEQKDSEGNHKKTDNVEPFNSKTNLKGFNDNIGRQTTENVLFIEENSVTFEEKSEDRNDSKNKFRINQEDELKKINTDLLNDKNIEESTVKNIIIDEDDKKKIITSEIPETIPMEFKKKNIDDKIAELPKNYQQNKEPFDGKNLTIVVVESGNSTGSLEGFTELFSILGQIASMLQLEKEFLDIGSAVLTPAGENSGSHIDKISEYGKEEDDSKQIKKGVLRVRRDIDEEEAIIGEEDDQESEADTSEAEELFEGSSKKFKFAFPSFRKLPPLSELKHSHPHLPKLPNLTRQSPPQSNTIDSLVSRAQNLMRNINPNLVDSVSSDSGINSEFVRAPLDTQNLNLKAQLAKNKFKIEQLRNKIQARIADYELKTKYLFNKDLKQRKLFKRDVTQDFAETNKQVKNIKQRLLSNKKVRKPISQLKQNMKRYLDKLKKVFSKKSHLGLNKYDNKIFKERSDNEKKLLRMKRYTINNGVGKDMSNDIFSFGDFDFKEEINKDPSNDNTLNPIVKNADYIFDKDVSEIGEKKSNIVNKDGMKCVDKTGQRCKVKENLANTILKLSPISKTDEEIPETKVRCQRDDFTGVQSDKLTWEDVKNKVGLSNGSENALNVMIDNVTSFFQNFPQKVKDFWGSLGG